MDDNGVEWIMEIGASLSAIRKFEELMGEYPEITAVLKENEGNNNIYIIDSVNEITEPEA